MYPGLNTVNATNDVTQILVYANSLTGGVLMPMVLFAFFFVVLLGSFFAQIRLSGRGRIELSFTVAGFTTFGFAVIMSSTNGLINPIYLLVSLAISIIGVMWLYFSQE